ncbi:hypothetical protein CPB84DRAFT_1822739 [Gymnopilus junonius]|uniref:Geranylgeranyl transferase type-2 subunit alpha n=1 Tax=Gymnopilus junonius TaxID=109634 RepID=A0A9P5TR75_GYMJU|nr:hypothetical protein CPB84DRAFT_1822739 [Gymnopilus junonius]
MLEKYKCDRSQSQLSHLLADRSYHQTKMHGIKRARLTEEEREARRRRELSKTDEFTKLSDATLARKKERDWSRDAFDLTTRLLQINPEFYTIWNYRRLILLNGLFVNAPAELVKDILLDELGMTMSALKAHPKVYWIWNHRRWCLEQIPYGPGPVSESHMLWVQVNFTVSILVVTRSSPRSILVPIRN